MDRLITSLLAKDLVIRLKNTNTRDEVFMFSLERR